MEAALKKSTDANEAHIARVAHDLHQALRVEYVAVSLSGAEALEATMEQLDFIEQG